MSRAWRNWGRSARCSPALRVVARDEDHVVDLVRAARERGVPVRAVGAGHSFAPLVSTTGLLLDTRQLTGPEAAEEPAAEDCPGFGAGTTLGELGETLHRRGLTVGGLATTTAPTLAGAIATGTHGGGRHASLSAQVAGVRVVTGTGDVLDVGAADPRLDALRLSLGVLGVVTRVALRCVPDGVLCRHERTAPLDALTADPEGWARSAEHVSAFWFPWQDVVLVRTWHVHGPGCRPAAPAPVARPGPAARAGLRAAASRLPLPAPVARIAAAPGRPRPGPPLRAPAHRAAVFPQRRRFAALEYAVALDRLPEAVAGLRAALAATGFVSPLPVELRPGPAEPTWLGPAHGRPTAWINLAAPRAPGRTGWLRAAERVLAGIGGRPHWAKLHGLDAAALRDRYPRWDDFAAVRATLDPDGVFLSPCTRRLLAARDG
ncbi:D-arabinono-1,4-lactone oxidase [Streptomyces sp. NPDC060194]|uniref:D-arabinono-1,4-lactone oxidase n=1 Tax=Streptomyces sp. NPDC060194 TaxID=3347069 RepID=UPI0036643BBC